MKDNLLMLKVGVIVAMAALLLLLVGITEATLSVSFTMIMVLLILVIFKTKNPGLYSKDERTIKLSSFAASWSWMVTIIVVSLLFWIEYTGVIQLTSYEMIAYIFITMVGSIVAFRFYFMHMGDV